MFTAIIISIVVFTIFFLMLWGIFETNSLAAFAIGFVAAVFSCIVTYNIVEQVDNKVECSKNGGKFVKENYKQNLCMKDGHPIKFSDGEWVK